MKSPSFKRQIVLTFAIGFSLLVGALVTYQSKLEQDILYRDSLVATTHLAQTLAVTSASWVMANDVVGLQETVQAIGQFSELRYAMVLSPAGRVLAHSDVTIVGQFVSDATSLALIQSRAVAQVIADDAAVVDVAMPIMLKDQTLGWVRLAQDRKTLAALLEQQLWSTAILVLLSAGLSLLAALWIANRLGYRINTLVEVSKKIQAGDLTTRAQISGTDEVSVLGIGINQMLDALARDKAKLLAGEQQLFEAKLAADRAVLIEATAHYTRSLIEANLDPLVTISPKGKITDVNHATEIASGRIREALMGSDFSDYFTEPEAARAGYRQVLLRGQVIDYPLALRHVSGRIIDVLCNASVYRNRAGEVQGVFAAVRDITERKRADELIRNSERNLSEAQRIAHIGSWYLDIASNQVTWTDELYKMYGFDPTRPPPPYTEHQKLFTPESWDRLNTALPNTRETGIPYELELETVRKDGSSGFMWARGEVVLDANGVTVGLRGVTQDITEQKRVEQREQLHTRTAHVNRVLQMLATHAPLPRVLDTIAREMEAFNPGLQCRILLQDDGGQAWQHDATPLGACWSQPILSAQGQVLGTFAVYHPQAQQPTLAEKKMVQDEAHLVAIAIEKTHTEARLQLAANVFTHAREGIMITDAAGIILEVNATFSLITGYDRDEVVGQNPRLLKSGRQAPEFYVAMWKALIDKGHWYGELWNRRKDGQEYAQLITISVVLDSAGRTQNYVALFSDITLMKEHEKQLETIAHYDALTDLPNRLLLTDRLHQALLQSQRRGLMLAVVYLDLDGFKQVNDQHGHNAGDALLIAVTQHMKEALREGDTLARIGGDEFVAVLVDLDDALACKPVLDRLLQAASMPLAVGDALARVSASIGVTFYPHDGLEADLLMRQADQAMYIAKDAGKNRYRFFDVNSSSRIMR